MNDIQNKLVEMKSKVPDCTSSRQRLRSILSDYFPTEKQLVNSILNAFDEDIETKLKESSDPALTASQLIKLLQNDYGLTSQSAFVAVESWCYMIGYAEIADAIGDVANVQSAQMPAGAGTPQQAPASACEIGFGIYKAGVDFPAGELSIQALKKARLDIKYGIGKDPAKIDDKNFFKDKTYIHIMEGEYLKLDTYDTNANFKFQVTKIN